MKRVVSLLLSLTMLLSVMVLPVAAEETAAGETVLALTPAFDGALGYNGKVNGYNKTDYVIDNDSLTALKAASDGDSLKIAFDVTVQADNDAYIQIKGAGNSTGTNYVFSAGKYIEARNTSSTSASNYLKDEGGNSSCPADTPIHMEIIMPLAAGGAITSSKELTAVASYKDGDNTITLTRTAYEERAKGKVFSLIEAWCRPQNDTTSSSTASTAAVSNCIVTLVKGEAAEPTTEPTKEPKTEKTARWDFFEYTEDKAVTNNADAAFSQDYDGMELHIGEGDRITQGGLVWTQAGGTKSDGTTAVTNNRYIKYTADKTGKLVITFKNSYQVSSGSNNNPRLYVISGADLSCTNKDNSTNNGVYATIKTADTDTILEAEVEANTSYYIWGYCYNHSEAPFTIKEIDFKDIGAEMKTRNIYGSNMLLQRNKPVYIDGTCTAAVTSATAQLINKNTDNVVQTKAVTVNGKEWNVTLDAVSDYGAAYSLVFKANGTDEALLTYDNILFGDVYLFSGQSNMWKEVSYYKSLDSADYAQAEVEKHTTDKIRVMYTQGSGDTGTAVLQYDARNAQTWKDFSTYSNVSPLPAVVFTTATTLYEETAVPIGVIANAYPGSYISSWFDSALKLDNCNIGKNSSGTSNERNWYCGRIYPLRNLELSGVFWYQGEADASTRYHGGENDASGDTVYSYYKRMMGNLITSWRELFDTEDLPFYYVQLCRLGRTTDENNPDTGSEPETPVKLAQTDTYLEMEDKTNIGVVGTLDLFGKYQYAEGNTKSGNCRTDIHPTQKAVVGQRLAAYALKDIYKKDVYTTGPIYKSAEVDGDKVIVTFEANGQLKIMNKTQYADSETDAKITAGTIKTDELNEFEIQDAEGWHKASAVIQGTNKVIVSAEGVTEPTGVRYAYSDYPDAPNLTDASELPSYTFMKEKLNGGTEPDPEPAGDYDNTAGHWRFDFGAETENGYYGVPYNRSFTDNLDYGFIGLKEDDYKLSAGQYMDSFRTVKGQKITLANGTREGDAPDNDFVALTNEQYPLRFAMAAENGGYYNVKVRLVNASDSEAATVSLFAEKRHQLLTNKEIPAGGYIDYEFNTDVETYYWKALNGQYKDDTLSIELVGKNAAISTIEVTKLEDKGTTLWVLGDSTGCDQPSNYPYYILNPYAGVGQALSKYLPKTIALSNQGDGGIASGDTNHYSVIKSEIKKGDYLYVEFGHNESGTAKYKENLATYYKDCHEKGANLVIVGPIDRCQDKQFNSSTGAWSSTLSGYSDTGKAFVEEKIAAGATDIAFVDLNASWIEFLNGMTKRVQQIRTEVAKEQNPEAADAPYEKNSVDYYYKYKASGVDQSHINDAGADNAAYIFFTQAKAAVEEGKTAEAGSYAKVNSDVLSGLVEGMRNEMPYTVPDEVIRAGKAPNSYYPVIPAEEYTGYETDITSAEISENGLLTSVNAKVSHYTGFEAKGIPYAVAIAEIYSADGVITGTYQSTTATKYDATNGNGTFTLKFDSTQAVIPEGGSYKIHLQGFTSDNTVMEGADNQVSDYYTGEKPLEYLIGDYEDISVPDTFMYYGVKEGSDINSNNGWYIIGSGAKSVKLMTEGEGESKTGYAEIRKTTEKSGSFVLYRAFENKYGTGKITLDTDLYYEGGYAKFQLSNKTSAPHTSSGLTQYIDCFYIDTNGKLYNSYKAELGDFPKNAWTHISYVLDLDRGTQILTVGSKEYSYNAPQLGALIPSEVFPSSVQQLNIVGASSQTMTINMKNTAAIHTTNTDLEEKTLTLENPSARKVTVTAEKATDAVMYGATYEDNTLQSVTMTEKALTAGENIIDVTDIEADKIFIWEKDTMVPLSPVVDAKMPVTAQGSVFISGSEGLTKTASINSNISISAAPEDGYKFDGWYEGDTLISSDADTKIRLHRDIILEAKFKPLVNVTVTAASANDEQGTATVNGNASATVLEDEIVTLKATPKDGFKFVSWTDSEGNVLSTSAKLTIKAEKTTAFTASFTALANGEKVWDFSNLPLTGVAEKATEEINKPYNGLDIHIGVGDSLTDDGIYWAHPGTTTSNSTAVSNNRYIKYTADEAGTLSVTFHSSYTASKANNNPRIYIISGTDESCMNKSGSDSGAKETTAGADKDTTVTVETIAGTTYYIWPYCYSAPDAPFNITNITFTAKTE